MDSFFEELRRRNVWRALLAYLAAAWLLIEIADTILPRFGFTSVAVTNVILLLVIGIVPVLVLSWFFDLTPEGLKRDGGTRSTSTASPRNTRTLDRLIVLMLILAVGFLAVDKFIFDPARDAVEIESATDKARADGMVSTYGDKSIAVLAFLDMSPKHDHEYFSDGISEELLNVLSTIGELRVISRSSAFSFKGSNASIQEIAEKLHVSYILEGSVRKAGDDIRVTAQLIDARTDTHIWSQTYDRTLNDIFAIQDEISEAIVEELKLTLLIDIAPVTKIDAQSYEKYLKAQFIVHTNNQDQLREAQQLLNEVLDEEPNYIPALNALGRLYYRIPKSEGMTRELNNAEIHALADRVIEIEPNGSSALVWQGWFAFLRSDMQEAANFYEKAMRVNPNYPALLRVVVSFLAKIGRYDEAIVLGNYLILRDPSCTTCINNLSHAYRGAGRYEESALLLQDILAWHTPTGGYYWSLGVSWLLAGDPEKALAAFEKELLQGNRKKMGTIMALHDLGRTEEFVAEFEDFRNMEGGSESVAQIYAWIGDSDKAFEWLQVAVDDNGPRILARIDTALYSKIKLDSRWRELRDKYGYSDDSMEDVEFNFVPPGTLVEH